MVWLALTFVISIRILQILIAIFYAKSMKENTSSDTQSRFVSPMSNYQFVSVQPLLIYNTPNRNNQVFVPNGITINNDDIQFVTAHNHLGMMEIFSIPDGNSNGCGKVNWQKEGF